jgi:hypothetical protein
MIMAYIKRDRHYSIVRGVTRGENGELVDTEVVVNGACRTADMAMKKARKINKDMLPMSAESHVQATRMDEAIYWANCEFGDDIIIDYPGPVNGNVVEDDIITEENN